MHKVLMIKPKCSLLVKYCRTRHLGPCSDNVEERLILALKGRVSEETDPVTTGSTQITAQPAEISAEFSKLQPQNGHTAGQSLRGWRSYAPFTPPAKAVNEDVNSGPTVVPSATLSPIPVTKEMAVRKRTFAEIIYLTSEDISASVEDHR
jgi:hypothetical protein